MIPEVFRGPYPTLPFLTESLNSRFGDLLGPSGEGPGEKSKGLESRLPGVGVRRPGVPPHQGTVREDLSVGSSLSGSTPSVGPSSWSSLPHSHPPRDPPSSRTGGTPSWVTVEPWVSSRVHETDTARSLSFGPAGSPLTYSLQGRPQRSRVGRTTSSSKRLQQRFPLRSLGSEGAKR